ncbi:hypothetical protein [Stenotrophomonas riyadhensis]
MADWIDGIALIGTLGSLWIARSALKLSRDANQLQQRMALAQVRPWVVTKGPCTLTARLCTGRPVSFAQWITLDGNAPAVRLRYQSYWELVATDSARQHFGIDRIKINRRSGEGSLSVLAPGQSQCLVNAKDRLLSDADFGRIFEGSHVLRIVVIVEYGHSSSPDTVFRTTTAAICDKSVLESFDRNAALPPTPDGFHLE